MNCGDAKIDKLIFAYARAYHLYFLEPVYVAGSEQPLQTVYGDLCNAIREKLCKCDSKASGQNHE